MALVDARCDQRVALEIGRLPVGGGRYGHVTGERVRKTRPNQFLGGSACRPGPSNGSGVFRTVRARPDPPLSANTLAVVFVLVMLALLVLLFT